MKFIPYNPHHADLWDQFLTYCPMATFLHSRKFLSYHKDRFHDCSYIITDDSDKWIGLFPAAISLTNPKQIISHPGITYGGILHQGKLIGQTMIDALSSLMTTYKNLNFKEMIYKPIPVFYHHPLACDDLYALFLANAQLYKRDLSCTIDLNARSRLSPKDLSKMRNALRKTEKNNITINHSTEISYLSDFWHMIDTHLQQKYAKNPVHTLDELYSLHKLFPDQIKLITAYQDSQILAGTVLFITNTVMHTQYLCVTELGKEYFALDYIIQHCISLAQNLELTYFDFGINTEHEGRYLNQSLYASKAKHGGYGTVHDFYKVTF